MLEILGILVAIGVFVFWCDVTDSWNNVFCWAKTRMDPRRAALAHHQTRAAQEQTADQEVEVLKQVCADSGQFYQPLLPVHQELHPLPCHRFDARTRG